MAAEKDMKNIVTYYFRLVNLVIILIADRNTHVSLMFVVLVCCFVHVETVAQQGSSWKLIDIPV